MTLNTLNPVPLPDGDALSQPRKRFVGETLRDVLAYMRGSDSAQFIAQRWSEFFNNMTALLQTVPTRVNSQDFDEQVASLGATDISTGALPAGYYRVSFYASVTRAATTSSSLIVIFDFTDGGLTKSISGAAMTGNTLSTASHGGGVIRIDQSSPVRVSTTYASVGGTTMRYDLVAVLERVEA